MVAEVRGVFGTLTYPNLILVLVQETNRTAGEVMTFPGVPQLESNDYFPPLAKIRIAFDHVFFDLFSIIAF